MSATPNSANFMLSVLRVLLEWSIPRGYRDDNPAVGVKQLKVEDNGHEPWTEDGYRFVMERAPTHLRRMAFLGRATGQRVSDLVKMAPPISPLTASCCVLASCATGSTLCHSPLSK